MGVKTGIACLGLVALLMSGCGSSGHTTGSGQTPNSSTGALSRGAFVDQVNAICKQAKAAQSKIAAPSSKSELSSSIAKETSTLQRYLAQLQSLSPRAPSDLKASYDQFVAKFGQLSALIPSLGKAAAASDTGKLTKLQTQAQQIQSAGIAAAKQANLGPECAG